MRRRSWACITTCFLLATVASTRAETAAELDATLLGACIDDVQAKEAGEYPFRGARVVLVERDRISAGEKMPRSSLFQVFPDLPLGTLSGTLDDLEARLGAEWKPPRKIQAAGVRVRVRKPRAAWTARSRPYFVFWPPGVDRDSGVALVLAETGHSPHGGVRATWKTRTASGACATP